MPASCPPPSPACPPVSRSACPAPRCAPAAPTPGHTSHSGSDQGDRGNVFQGEQEEGERIVSQFKIQKTIGHELILKTEA